MDQPPPPSIALAAERSLSVPEWSTGVEEARNEAVQKLVQKGLDGAAQWLVLRSRDVVNVLLHESPPGLLYLLAKAKFEEEEKLELFERERLAAEREREQHERERLAYARLADIYKAIDTVEFMDVEDRKKLKTIFAEKANDIKYLLPFDSSDFHRADTAMPDAMDRFLSDVVDSKRKVVIGSHHQHLGQLLQENLLSDPNIEAVFKSLYTIETDSNAIQDIYQRAQPEKASEFYLNVIWMGTLVDQILQHDVTYNRNTRGTFVEGRVQFDFHDIDDRIKPIAKANSRQLCGMLRYCGAFETA
ncbi:hypothetical protein HK405_000805 [Cladochytrium tenue]|nr:hypothetical protein HK405_000805 [Cladochytrium tenue]